MKRRNAALRWSKNSSKVFRTATANGNAVSTLNGLKTL